MGIVLIGKSVVVCSSRQQSPQPATARVKARWVPVPRVESWSPRGVQTPKIRPVESTGVHGVVAAVVSHGLAKERVVPPKEIDRAVERKKRFEANPAKHTYEEA